jgi:TetR/AcrR family transcriptional repressor of nem operon
MSITRERILELGEELIRTCGYNAFSYQDISSRLGIKNAAVHYYFPSKENLGTRVLKTNIQRFEEMIENLENGHFNEWQKLESFMKIYVRSNRESKVCLIGSLGPDFNTLNETMQHELRKMIEMIIYWLADNLTKGREKKLFAFVGDARSKALLILSNMVAGLQFARIMDKNDFKSVYQAVLEDLKP